MLAADEQLAGKRAEFYTWGAHNASEFVANGADPVMIVRMMNGTWLKPVRIIISIHRSSTCRKFWRRDPPIVERRRHDRGLAVDELSSVEVVSTESSDVSTGGVLPMTTYRVTLHGRLFLISGRITEAEAIEQALNMRRETDELIRTQRKFL